MKSLPYLLRSLLYFFNQILELKLLLLVSYFRLLGYRLDAADLSLNTSAT